MKLNDLTGRYLVFYGLNYYPNMGMKDCIGSCDDLNDGINYIRNIVEILEWGHIFDTVQRIIVYEQTETLHTEF